MIKRVDSAFEANREEIGPHFRVSVDHFSRIVEGNFKAELVSELGLRL